MSDPLQARVDELEIKTSFQEDLLRQLDEVLQTLFARVEHLEKELKLVRDTLPVDAVGPSSLVEDKPPHYGA